MLGLLGWDWKDSSSPLDGAVPVVTVNSLLTSDTTPALTGTISESTATVLVSITSNDVSVTGNDVATLTVDGTLGGHGFGSPGAEYTLINSATSTARIVRMDLTLPKNNSNFYLNTTFNSGDFAATSVAATVGLLSPQNDTNYNDGDVLERTKLLSLTFNNFDPGETFGWELLTINSSIALGHELAGAVVTIEFDNGVTVYNKLTAVGASNPDASTATFTAPHYLTATNNGNGTWTLPDNTLPTLGLATYDVEVLTVDSSGKQANDATISELTVTLTNAPPAVDLNGADAGFNYSATFAENGPPVNIVASTATITDSDNTTLANLKLVVSAAPNGADEKLTIAGAAVPLNANLTTTATAGGTTFQIVYVSASRTFTITKNGGGSAPIADLQTLLLGVTYENVNDIPNTPLARSTSRPMTALSTALP